MYRHTLIVLVCAAISAPAFAQSDKCPYGLGSQNRPDGACRYLDPPTPPIHLFPDHEPSGYDSPRSPYSWDQKITKPENTFTLPDYPIGVGRNSIYGKGKF